MGDSEAVGNGSNSHEAGSYSPDFDDVQAFATYFGIKLRVSLAPEVVFGFGFDQHNQKSDFVVGTGDSTKAHLYHTYILDGAGFVC